MRVAPARGVARCERAAPAHGVARCVRAAPSPAAPRYGFFVTHAQTNSHSMGDSPRSSVTVTATGTSPFG